jgi:hypothetical protein
MGGEFTRRASRRSLKKSDGCWPQCGEEVVKDACGQPNGGEDKKSLFEEGA